MIGYLNGKGHRPLIGVTGPAEKGRIPFLCVSLAVWMAGGRVLRLTPEKPHHDTDLDGLVICGGTDIHPSLYDEITKINYVYDRDRDALEVHWLKRAEEQDWPVLGICRGAQLLNVLRGGNLHMDIRQAFEEADYPTHLLANIFFRKTMHIVSGTLLHRLWGKRTSRVNSLHSQSINRLGRGLVVGARERNGIIQAVEDARKPFVLGVQFHPEYLIYRKSVRRLFASLVAEARGEERERSLSPAD